MRSATATTAEMFGKLNLKVVHGGDASLSSIKVMQPKQVRVSKKSSFLKGRGWKIYENKKAIIFTKKSENYNEIWNQYRKTSIFSNLNSIVKWPVNLIH